MYLWTGRIGISSPSASDKGGQSTSTDDGNTSRAQAVCQRSDTEIPINKDPSGD